MKCPMCKGSGIIDKESTTFRSNMDTKRRIAKELFKNGCTYRQVTKILGYTSTNAIRNLIQEGKDEK